MSKKLPPPPDFDTPEEEDEFWQTHSPLDFEHKEVDIPEPRQFVRPNGRLIVQLSPAEQELLKRIAKKKGEQPMTLALRYIQSGLQIESENL